MHWFHLPKVTHNEDAIREYELRESQKLGRWIKGIVIIGLPVILLVIWLIRR